MEHKALSCREGVVVEISSYFEPRRGHNWEFFLPTSLDTSLDGCGVCASQGQGLGYITIAVTCHHPLRHPVTHASGTFLVWSCTEARTECRRCSTSAADRCSSTHAPTLLLALVQHPTQMCLMAHLHQQELLRPTYRCSLCFQTEMLLCST